jgi:hypothetical protein
MSKAIDLIPLVCTRCQTPIPAEPDEVAWVCAQCGQGLLLDEEKGAAPIAVNYAAGIPANQKGWPFWVANGQVTIAQRRIYGSGDQGRQAAEFWQPAHRFFIPAFNSPLDQLIAWGASLLQRPPALQPGPPAGFAPVILHLEDIQPVAEFIVLGIEADRKDKIRGVDFTLQLSAPELWVLWLGK